MAALTSKRRKTTVAVDKENVPTTTARRRRTSKKLGGTTLADVPFDVLLEIAHYLLPLDILHLARVNKLLRSAFMTKASAGAWRVARRNLEGCPESFTGMSEPAWVHLAFVKICHFCWKKSVPTPDFHLCCRICPSCSVTNLVGQSQLKEGLPQNEHPKIDKIFAAIPAHFAIYQQRKKKDCYAQVIDYEAAFLLEENELDSLVTQREEQEADAIECDLWVENCVSNRKCLLEQLRIERQKAIHDRLAKLGYKKDLEFMDGIGQQWHFERHWLVKGTQPVTDRVWANMEESMIEYAEDLRATRLKKEHVALRNSRKHVAASVLRAFKSDISLDQPYPSIADFCAMAPVEAILDQPGDVTVTAKSFDTVLQLMPGLCQTWREGVYQKLVKVVANGHAKSQSMQHVKLASNVLLCESCSRYPDNPTRRRRLDYIIRAKLLFYPETITHSCTRSDFDPGYDPDFTEKMPDAAMRVAFQENHMRVPWFTQRLRKPEVLSTIARKVVILAGLDPDEATVKEMDARGSMFECKWCSALSADDNDEEEKRLPDRVFFSWRIFIRHVFQSHFYDYDKVDKHVEVLNEADALPEKYRFSHKEDVPILFECTHCRDLPNEELDGQDDYGVRDHLDWTHGIEEPEAGKDYCRMLGEPLVPRREKTYWVPS